MTRQEFRELWRAGTVILDGATGTNLQAAGMPVGVCPEKWILENRQILLELQKEFVRAGSQILLAPTFTANRLKLADYGLDGDLERINRELVALTRAAAGDTALVAADMTMTGRQVVPLGDLSFEALVDIYKEQARVLADAGADLFFIETMMSLQETRAAVIAVRETCDLPVMASLTFEADGRSLFGTTPEAAVTVLQSLGADAVGMNCSTGPEGMLDNLKKMAAAASVPLIAKPNAGLPQLVDGKTVYPAAPEEFAEAAKSLVEAGASLVGGCCGTTPEHIRQMAAAVREVPAYAVDESPKQFLASERYALKLRAGDPLRIIGERINPTGKKALQAELRAGSLELVMKMAREQQEAGASLLDVNIGTGGIDEKETMLRAVTELSQAVDLPLVIDSSRPEVIEAALRIYPGRALINSISQESAKCGRLLDIAEKYGAMFIFLPVSDAGLPATQQEKHALIDAVLAELDVRGMHRDDMVVDALAATVGAEPEAGLRCLGTIRHCREELGLFTVIGLSNISFGLPVRPLVNETFLVMAASAGLTMAIANPTQESLMDHAAAADILLKKTGADRRYLARAAQIAERQPIPAPAAAGKTGDAAAPEPSADKGSGEEPEDPLFRAVLDGDQQGIRELAEAAVASGREPQEIIDGSLIPAINRVGELFDQKKFFLPQLIYGASAMECAIRYLEPLIRGGGRQQAETVVIATVQGDVHDIGKNLVALMLRNYGYRVIDLGKDVPAERILQVASAESAAVIGLSALMTTTMMRMKDVIGEAARLQYQGKIIVGGAAVTENFAQEIGADGYSEDAAGCVRLVDRLLGKR